MTDKPDKIKVIIWEQLDSKIVQRAEETVKHLQALIEDDNFDCLIDDRVGIKLTAAYMTESELEKLPEFQGF